MDDVTLLAEDGAVIGAFPKSEVHTTDTPLHLAFSCHLVDEQGRILLTRRALSKLTWPGVWTNSFCGHPGPGEEFEDAILRRAQFELGVDANKIELILPHFRYRAIDPTGIVENEVCPVYVARITGVLNPNPAEVADWAWISPALLADALEHTPSAFSPWLGLQFPQLLEANALPLQAGAEA